MYKSAVEMLTKKRYNTIEVNEFVNLTASYESVFYDFCKDLENAYYGHSHKDKS